VSSCLEYVCRNYKLLERERERERVCVQYRTVAYSKVLVIHIDGTRSHNLILYTGCREPSIETNTYIVEFVADFSMCLILNIGS